MLFTARLRLRTVGMRIAMKTAEGSHITIHKMGEASDLGASDLVIHSRIMNGSTQKIKLITVADIGFASMVFIITPSVISSACSLTMPLAVSANSHSKKLDLPPSVCRVL